MRVSFIDNVTQRLIEVLAAKLPQANSFKCAVAFVSGKGLSLIQPYLQQLLDIGGKTELLIGLDLLTTEPESLRKLYEMSQSGLSVACFCYSDLFEQGASIYHPKLYLVDSLEKMTIVVGSSNLTTGGLKGNLEINAVLEADPSEEIVSDVYAIYNRLKFGQPRVELDGELISLYEAVHSNAKRKTRLALADSETKELLQRFREKVAKLQYPKATGHDLFGWQKIVYERLPLQAFRTSDMYVYEREFQEYYPENKHVRDKTRQILQQLRYIGLLGNPRRDRWERI